MSEQELPSKLTGISPYTSQAPQAGKEAVNRVLMRPTCKLWTTLDSPNTEIISALILILLGVNSSLYKIIKNYKIN